jgi:hypothetical protein
MMKRCPHDGGYCHHECPNPLECFRESGGMALTVPAEGYPLPGHKMPDPPLSLENLRRIHAWLEAEGDARIFSYEDREWIHRIVRALFDEFTDHLCVTCGSGEGEECTCADPAPIGRG